MNKTPIGNSQEKPLDTKASEFLQNGNNSTEQAGSLNKQCVSSVGRFSVVKLTELNEST